MKKHSVTFWLLGNDAYSENLKGLLLNGAQTAMTLHANKLD